MNERGFYYLNKNGLHKLPDGWYTVFAVVGFAWFVGTACGYAWRVFQMINGG